MIDVSANADTLRALESVAHLLEVRRSALDNRVRLHVGPDTLESYLRYHLGTYGPVRLNQDVKDHAAMLYRGRLDTLMSDIKEWTNA